ncbi:uncharacterized protein EDB93DRAFT_1249108 [Suillus bovinus]|uniref:uncharacterized protein n=1 Tax=Suillus bovinus TaxID=48563 RepID=UPI001B87E2DF|nr:uncharacterized protein EDB93DRAFT_1249108 [Suillus bovinus]KAG2152596.1 hypothetical protein EDB93DRAFT_1249108 [Suillus bovinus]
MVTQHVWCHIHTVEVFVWVRGDDGSAIDLDNKDNMAHGTLLPDINMDAVKLMLKQGLGKIRDSLIAFSKQLNPEIDCTELEESIIALVIRWKDFVIALNNGADVTAWRRYRAWHKKIIKDRLAGGLELSCGRPKRKRTSTSLPPSRKSKHAL